MNYTTSNGPQRRTTSSRDQRPRRERGRYSDDTTRSQSPRRRARTRAAGVEPVRRGPDRHNPRLQRSRNRTTQTAGPHIPLIPTVVAGLVVVVLAVVITRAVVLRGATSTSGTNGAATREQTAAANTTGTEQSSVVEVKDGSARGTTTGSGSGNVGFEAQPGSGVKSPWTKSGTFTSGDATLDDEVKEFCDKSVSKDMQYDEALQKVYTDIAWSDYVERDEAQHPAGKNWRLEMARQYYENNCSGNCYEFAAFLAYCLQYMGLEDAHAEGVLIQMQSGGWGDHGVVYVTSPEGVPSICDTARGLDAWLIKESSYNVQIQDFENA